MCLQSAGLFLKIAKMTELDQHTVSGIIREYENCGQLLDSKRQRPGRKKFCTVDLSTRAAVRNVIHSFYSRNESPTIEKIHAELRKDTSYKHCRSSTYKIMKSLGSGEIDFTFAKDLRLWLEGNIIFRK